MTGGLTRDKRLARQELDDGDPGETVFYLGLSARSKGRAYHDDADCRWLQNTNRPDDVAETTRRGAQHRWLAPCAYCILGYTPAELTNDSEGVIALDSR